MRLHLRPKDLLTLACALAFTTAASWNDPHNEFNALHVTIDGQQLGYHDVIVVTGIDLGGADVTAVSKDTTQMPPPWKYVYYAGKDERGRPIVWKTSAATNPAALQPAARIEFRREEVAVAIQATIEFAKTGAGLQTLYQQAKGDPGKLVALASDLQKCVPAMSQLVVEQSNQNRTWMFATFHPSKSRASILAALQERGFQPATDKSDDIIVGLEGAFEPGCYFHNNVTIVFDAHDRLERMDYSEPIPDCL